MDTNIMTARTAPDDELLDRVAGGWNTAAAYPKARASRARVELRRRGWSAERIDREAVR